MRNGSNSIRFISCPSAHKVERLFLEISLHAIKQVPTQQDASAGYSRCPLHNWPTMCVCSSCQPFDRQTDRQTEIAESQTIQDTVDVALAHPFSNDAVKKAGQEEILQQQERERKQVKYDRQHLPGTSFPDLYSIRFLTLWKMGNGSQRIPEYSARRSRDVERQRIKRILEEKVCSDFAKL